MTLRQCCQFIPNPQIDGFVTSTLISPEVNASMRASFVESESEPWTLTAPFISRAAVSASVLRLHQTIHDSSLEFASPAAAFARPSERVQASALQTVQRKVISSASVSLEVEVVEDAVDQVRVIAEGVGGFVEQLSSSGGPERQRATMTIRVPQDQFTSVLERIEDLGAVQNKNLGSEDVSAQFIDLEARLRSSLQEEESLLSLLERAGVVSEVLAIERELFRVRADIERFQGQLNFLERRVDLATISISLAPPEVDADEPPSANLAVLVADVGISVESIKGLVDSVDGEVDRVFLSQRDGREEAQLILRVFSREFSGVMDFLEGQGKVRSKEVVEGSLPPGGAPEAGEEPQARIILSLLAEDDSLNVGLIAAIAGPLGGIALAGVLGGLFFWAYRAGRRGSRGF